MKALVRAQAPVSNVSVKVGYVSVAPMVPELLVNVGLQNLQTESGTPQTGYRVAHTRYER